MRGKALKLKSILILFMAGFIFAALGISGGISFRMFEGAMVDKIGDSRADVLSQISEKISGIKMSMDLLSDLYFYNENLTGLYKREGYSWEDRRRIRENFERIEELSAMTSTVMEMDFYYAFLMENGYCYSSNPGAEGSLEDYKDRIWFPGRRQNILLYLWEAFPTLFSIPMTAQARRIQGLLGRHSFWGRTKGRFFFILFFQAPRRIFSQGFKCLCPLPGWPCWRQR